MAYLLSNICTINYWNQTTIVEIIVGGWVVSFFETQCIYAYMVDIQSATAEIRRGKKNDRKKYRKNPQGKNIMFASATQGGHKQQYVLYMSLQYGELRPTNG